MLLMARLALPRGCPWDGSEPFAPLDVFLHATVLDLPQARAFLHVLELSPHGLIEIVAQLDLLAEGAPELAAQLVVRGVDFVDVARLHQHFEHLIEQIVDGAFPELDVTLLGEQLAGPPVLGLGETPGGNHVASLLADLLLVADVLAQDGFQIRLHFCRRLRFDVARFHEGANHFGRHLGDLGAVQTHRPLPYQISVPLDPTNARSGRESVSLPGRWRRGSPRAGVLVRRAPGCRAPGRRAPGRRAPGRRAPRAPSTGRGASLESTTSEAHPRAVGLRALRPACWTSCTSVPWGLRSGAR